jgi:hypothetical protein
MPEPTVMKLRMYIVQAESISTAYFINPPISNINFTASQISEAEL